MLVPLQFGSNVRATYAATTEQHASGIHLCVFIVLVLCVFFELTFQLSSSRKVMFLRKQTQQQKIAATIDANIDICVLA